MKSFVIILGVILLVLGVIGLVHPNFNYHQQEEVETRPHQSNRGRGENRANPGSRFDNSPGSRHRACCTRAAHEAVVSATNSLDWYPITYLPSLSTLTAALCGTAEAMREHTSAASHPGERTKRRA